MKIITVKDATLCREGAAFGFKEKLEIARQLERLQVSQIDLPEIADPKTDVLLVRTLSAFVKEAVVSVAAGIGRESLPLALQALSAAKHPSLRVELPVSPVGMEYMCHKKPAAMLAHITEAVTAAKAAVPHVEFRALDATRAEPEFLTDALKAAIAAGASEISLSDDAGELLPDDFAAFCAPYFALGVPVSVLCDNRRGLAVADAVLAVRAGASGVVCAVGGDVLPLEVFSGMIQNSGERYGLSVPLRQTELHRIVSQIARVTGTGKAEAVPGVSAPAGGEDWTLTADETPDGVAAAVASLGYDLSDEDKQNVYSEVCRVAANKPVGAKELDAIVATAAMQVPQAYLLDSYVVNNGNIIKASAQLTLTRGGEKFSGICMGDGPIDAAFRAVEQIIGRHFELDDFKIAAVTEGREAVGEALVKLRSDGKLFSGKGVSTDIIGAAIRAYISAVNKIVYEEA